jgi:hypothetical protein
LCLQGFQCFVEDLSGWGHFSHDLLQLIQDEYVRAPALLFALRPPAAEPSPEHDVRRTPLTASASHVDCLG